jgi:hypothetical protein
MILSPSLRPHLLGNQEVRAFFAFTAHELYGTHGHSACACRSCAAGRGLRPPHPRSLL